MKHNEQYILGNFFSAGDVFRRFRVSEEDQKGVEILFAEYLREDYCGGAYVLFKRNKKLYEVVGSHCSCFGLEGQWDPNETNIGTIQKILTDGRFYRQYDKAKLKEVIGMIS